MYYHDSLLLLGELVHSDNARRYLDEKVVRKGFSNALCPSAVSHVPVEFLGLSIRKNRVFMARCRVGTSHWHVLASSSLSEA
mgnify:CR=1 FL=1